MSNRSCAGSCRAAVLSIASAQLLSSWDRCAARTELSCADGRGLAVRSVRAEFRQKQVARVCSHQAAALWSGVGVCGAQP